MGAVSGLKADLGSISVVKACGCTIRRNSTNNYTMTGPNAFVPVAYDTDDASLCEQWERFLVVNSPMEGKSPKLTLELFDGAEWRASQWLEDGAKARALDDAELAQKCFERCHFWLERAQHFSAALQLKS